MTDHIHDQTVPRGAILGAAALMIATIGLATAARLARIHQPVAVAPAPIESLDVRFEDRPDGALAVVDARDGHDVRVLAPGTNNFIRGVVRGMFRGRKLESLGHDGDFRLAREADGRLTLDDREIGRHVELDSFGPTNSAAFAELLVAARRSP